MNNNHHVPKESLIHNAFFRSLRTHRITAGLGVVPGVLDGWIQGFGETTTRPSSVPCVRGAGDPSRGRPRRGAGPAERLAWHRTVCPRFRARVRALQARRARRRRLVVYGGTAPEPD